MPVKKGRITDEDLRKREIDFPVQRDSRTEFNQEGYLPSPDDDKLEPNRGYLASDKYNKEEIPKHPKNPSDNHTIRLLTDIHHFPLSNTTQRYKRLGMNPERGNQYKNMLISQGCIEPIKIITKFVFNRTT
ncbi:MAG: hypothetical protein AB1847_14090 [bacterium]